MNDRLKWLRTPGSAPTALGFGLALATSLAGAAVYVYFHVQDRDSLVSVFLILLPPALLASVLASRTRRRAAESEERRREADALAGQQSALRQVATLVAAGAPPSDVYSVAVTELARGLPTEHVTLAMFEGAQCVVVAAHHASGKEHLTLGERLPFSGDPARSDDYRDIEGAAAERMRGLGVDAGVGAPVTVDGRLRGALLVGSARAESMPAETEDRIRDFADLIGMSIGNAENRAELQASRARIVAATDRARRDIERNLHDGAQQRVASLGLGLRTLEASLPEDDHPVRKQVDNLIHGMADLYTELQELSRAIHPAVLSKSGLGPALKALARRSSVPVALDFAADRRLPESAEMAAYYVVAEALTNMAEHAGATEVAVRVRLDGDDLLLDVADNGVGGAIVGGGLLALTDRVQSVSGQLEVTSAASTGTTVSVRIPGPSADG